MYREAWVWSKWDEKDLADFVNPAVIDILGKLAAEPYDQPEDADGRRRILELIYNKLLESGISYALEKFSYADDVQKIRAPSEILNGAARGTCLDLSLLFAGLAEGYDLVPVVVLTEGHAFVIVSLKNGRREWDSFGRAELQDFMEPVRNMEVLRKHVDDGSYVAIECTGFAASEKLRDNPNEAYPETLGRNEQGLLPFEQALASGRGQLFDRQEELGFALDITVAHRHKEPLEIGNATSIVAERTAHEAASAETADGEASVAAAGEDLVELDMRSEHGAKVNPTTEAENPEPLELPTPVRPRVKPLKGLIGRDTEKGMIQSAMDDEETVGVHSGNGWGKTALMRGIAYSDTAEFPDGVVYLKVPQQPINDVLRDIHDQFYRTDTPVKPSESTIKQRLADKRAVVILDELGLDSSSVENLTFALPESFFVLASNTPSPFGEAFPLKLAGLSSDEALTLFEKRLRRAITAEEQEAARAICNAVDNHPGRLIEAGNAVLGGQSLAEVARTFQGAAASDEEIAEVELPELSPLQQKVAEILAVANVPVSLALLERVLADDLQGVPDGLHNAVRALIASERVEAHSPRYSLTGTVADAARGHWDSADWMGTLLTNLADWSESPEVTNDEINRDRQFILRALEWGVEAERWTEVVRVARAADSGIALGGRWGAWQQVLTYALAAAEQLGPAGESSKAWALHQIGARAIGIGDDATALANLTEALDIRKRLGETEAVKVTRHNLNLVAPAPLIRPGALSAAIGGVLAVLLLLLVPSPPDWTNQLGFDPDGLTFANIAIGDSEEKTVELVNPTDHDISGIQLSVWSSTGEFALGAAPAGGEAAPADAARLVAMDMPLAAAGTGAAEAAKPCQLDENNVLTLEKDTRCSVTVVYTRSQPAAVSGILRARLGDDQVESVLQVAGGVESTTTTTPPEAVTTTTNPESATTTTTSEVTTTTAGRVLPEVPSVAIIDIAHEIVVFEGDGPQEILLTNVGGVGVTIEGLVEPDNFSAAGCVGVTLGEDETCTIVVTFDGGPGLHCEILEIVYDGTGEQQVFLKGGN